MYSSTLTLRVECPISLNTLASIAENINQEEIDDYKSRLQVFKNREVSWENEGEDESYYLSHINFYQNQLAKVEKLDTKAISNTLYNKYNIKYFKKENKWYYCHIKHLMLHHKISNISLTKKKWYSYEDFYEFVWNNSSSEYNNTSNIPKSMLIKIKNYWSLYPDSILDLTLN